MKESERLQHLEASLPQIGGHNIMNNSKLTTSVGDYREVEILPDSVIYCDPPYRATREYMHNKEAFDHQSFYDWCEKQTALVLISEYTRLSRNSRCYWKFWIPGNSGYSRKQRSQWIPRNSGY